MRLLIHTVIFSLVFVFNLAQASGAALAIITEPSDAEIYVNSELRTNTTPIVLKLSAGTYQIQIKRAGKETQEFPIMLTDESVVIKRVSLVDAKPVVIDLKAMLSPVRDSFETEEEFTVRSQLIIKQFNDAVAKRDLSYRAGIARLNRDGYDIDNETFPLEITWDAWATQFKLATSGQLTIPRDQARSLWNEGAEKPVFLIVDSSDIGTIFRKSVLLGLGQQWDIFHEVMQKGYTIDGTVVDAKTGLMWKSCNEGQTWDGITCKGTASELTIEEVMPNNAQRIWPIFAGYDNWRVPTREELRSLVYCSNGTPKSEARDNSCAGKERRNGTDYRTPTIDIAVFPNTPSNRFLTSSTYAGVEGVYWSVNFTYGYDRGTGSEDGNVRLVRRRQ